MSPKKSYRSILFPLVGENFSWEVNQTAQNDIITPEGKTQTDLPAYGKLQNFFAKLQKLQIVF